MRVKFPLVMQIIKYLTFGLGNSLAPTRHKVTTLRDFHTVHGPFKLRNTYQSHFIHLNTNLITLTSPYTTRNEALFQSH